MSNSGIRMNKHEQLNSDFGFRTSDFPLCGWAFVAQRLGRVNAAFDDRVSLPAGRSLGLSA
jgi:hypothetical protein